MNCPNFGEPASRMSADADAENAMRPPMTVKPILIDDLLILHVCSATDLRDDHEECHEACI